MTERQRIARFWLDLFLHVGVYFALLFGLMLFIAEYRWFYVAGLVSFFGIYLFLNRIVPDEE